MPRKGFDIKDFSPMCELCGKQIREHCPSATKKEKHRLYFREEKTVCWKCKNKIDAHETTPKDIEYRKALILHRGLRDVKQILDEICPPMV